jgi:hypothetical protein
MGDQTHGQLVGSLIEHELHHDVLVDDVSIQADMVSISHILTDHDILHRLGT